MRQKSISRMEAFFSHYFRKPKPGISSSSPHPISSRSYGFTSSNSFHRYFANWRLVTSFLIGAGIGWFYQDWSTKLNGNSMVPTLESGERVLLVPSYVLKARHYLFPHFFPSVVQEGDIVVARISKTLVVCKRIVEIWNSTSEMEEDEHNKFSSPEENQQLFNAYAEYFASLQKEETEHHESFPQGNKASDISAKPQFPLSQKSLRTSQWDEARQLHTNKNTNNLQQWMWLEGDNKANSFDSRKAGCIPMHSLHGKVIGVIYPNPRFLKNH